MERRDQIMNIHFLSGIPLSVTYALSCVWRVWYNQKRSTTTTPTTPGGHPKPAYFHSHHPRSTHHGHPPPQRTYRPQASNRHPNKKIVSKMLTICSLLFWDAGQGELTHAGHRLSKRIYHAVRILLLFIIASMVGPLHNHPQG